MLLLSATLAGDPQTPGSVLRALAEAGHGDRYLSALLAAHPHLPDDGLPAQAGEDLDAHWRAARDAEGLHLALRSEAATDATRARAMRQAALLTLVSYLESWAADPDVVTELATRTLPHAPDLRVRAWTSIALRPGAPDPEHLRAVEGLLALPSGDYFTPAKRNRLSSATMLTSLLTQALRHPEHLRRLVDVSVEESARAMLQQYADVHDAGRDVLAQFRSDTITQHETATSRWSDVIEATGDPGIARHVTGLALPAHENPAVVMAIHDHPALLLPSLLDAQLAHPDGRIPRDVLERRSLDSIRQAGHSAHMVAASAAPHHHGAAALVKAGWATLHGGDLANALDLDAALKTDFEDLARYALHPSMPEAARLEARSVALARDVSTDIALGRRAHVEDLSYLLERAGSVEELQATLQQTPLPQLRRLTQAGHYTGQLVTWHLARALRPHHVDLTPGALRVIVALEPDFTGTPTELIATAATLAI